MADPPPSTDPPAPPPATVSTNAPPTTEHDMAATTSNYVYIRDAEYAWIPARVEKTTAEGAHVVIPEYKDEKSIQSDAGRRAKRFRKEIIKVQDYPNAALPLQNVDEHGNLKQVEDMVDLSFLHEAAIMYNLKARHVIGKPYTRTGDIVIACNPYQWILELYSEQKRHEYATALIWESSYDITEGAGDPRANIEPHVYEASSLAYRGLAVEGEDQSILVSGESGAGKTETVKILMNDLASVQRENVGAFEKANITESTSTIVQRVLDSNPLLEAFGNAKTMRNDNSSRFGKYIQLQFHGEDPETAAFCGKSVPSCILAGSKCEVYLLEKSRVVSHEEEERTFHIFYQLLAAPEAVKIDIWPELEDTDNESFIYVGYTETGSIEDKTDAERFQLTVDSLALIGVEGEMLRMLMRAICIVLQLGNLVFEPDPADSDKTEVTSEDELVALAELMGIPRDELVIALTFRTVQARGEEYKVPLNDERARESTDAFAKEIYAKTFLWLVRTINDATCAERNYEGDKKSGFGIIGLLDIFGFESFETNRFEQLCINYANEKLQQKFTQDIFRSVQAEYEYEGIQLAEITYDDNTDVLDLVEGRMGLLSFLNEECIRPNGSDKAFVSKVDQMNRDCPCWVREKSWQVCQFGIIHYAGKVVYDATNFVTKNQDNLPMDLEECALKSTNHILAHELTNDSTMNAAVVRKRESKKAPNKKSKIKVQRRSTIVSDTVWTKFKSQLTNLMMTLESTRTRYIRCIKPNQMKLPYEMQHLTTIEQLRCAGVVAAVTISRSAFPNRLEHEVILERFKSLWDKGSYPSEMVLAEIEYENQAKYLVEHLLTSSLKPLEKERNNTIMKAFVIGRSRSYFRAGSLEFLESERLKKLGVWAVDIQRMVRGFTERSKYYKLRKAVISLQADTRRQIGHRNYRKLKSSSIQVQCWLRVIYAIRYMKMARRNFKATLIQNHWRMAVAIVNLKIHRNAAIAIQKIARGAIQRPKFRTALHEKREEAKLENRLKALQKQLEEAEQRRIEAEKKAEEKARQAVQEYRNSTAIDETKEKVDAPPTAAAVVPASPGASTVPQSAASVAYGAAPSVPASPAPHGAAISDDRSVTSASIAASSIMPAAMALQQQNLIDESGKMLEYLRKEVFKLRNHNAQMRTDFELLKDNNQRLMDANASAGASFAALNQHAKQLSKQNAKLTADLQNHRHQIQKLNLTQVELKEELKMKQATYIAEVHSRLQYQKALSRIVELVSEKCRDTRLVENALAIADDCEAEYMSGSPGQMQQRPETSQADFVAKNSDSVLGRFKFWG